MTFQVILLVNILPQVLHAFTTSSMFLISWLQQNYNTCVILIFKLIWNPKKIKYDSILQTIIIHRHIATQLTLLINSSIRHIVDLTQSPSFAGLTLAFMRSDSVNFRKIFRWETSSKVSYCHGLAIKTDECKGHSNKGKLYFFADSKH